MFKIQLKSIGFWWTLLVSELLFGMITETSSSVNSSAIKSSSSTTSTFHGNLYINGPTFARPSSSSGSNYYYQLIRVTVYTSGTYSLTSNSQMDTYGCLYDTVFDPSHPSHSLVCNDDSGISLHFLINYNFENTQTYILVVTTSSPYISGSYSITVTGPGAVIMTEIPVISTTKSGYLSSNNPTFARPDRYSSNYYYESIQVTTSTTGSYTFKSRSLSSTDLYGCLYRGSFIPSSPLTNKIICADDNGGDRQFEFFQVLSPSITYTLVITTAFPSTTGSYSVSVTGPSSVSMIIITPNTYKFPIAAVVGIAVGCFAICVALILSICVRQRRHRRQPQAIITQGIIAPQYNSGGQYALYPVIPGTIGQNAPPPYISYVSA